MEVNQKSKLIFEEESYLIRGAVFEVYKEMGCGFLEAIYQECLLREFQLRGIPYVRHPQLEVAYKGDPLPLTYVPDFICYDTIILELKSVKTLAPEHIAQLMNYLKITNKKLGFLINFGSHPQVHIERIVY